MDNIYLLSIQFRCESTRKNSFFRSEKEDRQPKTVDQKVQQDIMDATFENRNALFAIEEETFERHTIILRNILETNSYPNYDRVGIESSNNYWLCVQQSDKDLNFQKKVLKLMKKEVRNKKADSKNYAYLKDRVKINLGKSQIYGTQAEYKTGRQSPRNLKIPKLLTKGGKGALIHLKTTFQ
ncbi:DUF6624 domain-containing protein [Chryseobacterium indologenes]|uniref:DUF6624 domain-containing protein n=1 Tax=Chryseobacterium indologenes TaxID=253 RepID=UPI0010243525|nr:DUF6624 domain-containing protein [Chryseobacterium indologenes]VFA44104.1 Uncharacterised protein [Chryseobacterium indologenes]